MFIEQFSTLHMTFVRIVEIDWLLEQLKGIFHKNIIISFSETIGGMGLILCMLHIPDISLHINCFYCDNRIRTLIGMATYSFY